MRYFITIIPVFYAVVCHSQTFDQLIRKADSLYNAHDYEQSAIFYANAFKQNNGSAENYYDAACSAALAGNKGQAINFLTASAELGYHNKRWLLQDPDLRSIHDFSGWDAVLHRVQANQDEYEKDMNKPLKAQLENIYMRDQTLRQLLENAEEKFGNDSDEMRYLWQIILHEDSLNEIEVVQIIDKNGWVGKTEVGGMANTALWLVIQHANLELQEKYLPLLSESVKKGESKGSNLALMQDRILMRKNEKQIYGSQIVRNQDTGMWEVYPVKDPDNVNKRRAEVGLGPIEEYLSRWGIDWNSVKKNQ